MARRRKNTEPKYSIKDCLAAIKHFLAEFEGRKTQANYASFAPKHGLPSISRFERFGGWTTLRRNAEKLP